MGTRKIKKKIKQKKEKFEFTPEFRQELLHLIKGSRSPEDIAKEFVQKEIIPQEKVSEIIEIISNYRAKKMFLSNILIAVGAACLIIGGYFALRQNSLILVPIVGIIVTIAGIVYRKK